MHILLTGGSGFIGSNLARRLLALRPDWTLTNIDALTYAGNPDNTADLDPEPRYTFVHADVRDLDTLTPLVERADAIIHAAAESHVDRSLADARRFVENNVLGTQSILDAMRTVDPENTKRLVHVSTDEVFGELPLDRPELRFTETTPYAPSSPYAASKAAADVIVRAHHRSFGLDACVTICSNTFGPYQFPEKLIPRFVYRLMRGEKVPLFGDGRNVRDWLHVDDHADAILAVLERGRSGETYAIGADNERSNLELTLDILRVMGRDESSIERVPDRPGHDLRYAIDATKVRAELGWSPAHTDWPTALAETVAWYVNNPEWCARARARVHG